MGRTVAGWKVDDVLRGSMLVGVGCGMDGVSLCVCGWEWEWRGSGGGNSDGVRSVVIGTLLKYRELVVEHEDNANCSDSSSTGSGMAGEEADWDMEALRERVLTGAEGGRAGVGEREGSVVISGREGVQTRQGRQRGGGKGAGMARSPRSDHEVASLRLRRT